MCCFFFYVFIMIEKSTVPKLDIMKVRTVSKYSWISSSGLKRKGRRGSMKERGERQYGEHWTSVDRRTETKAGQVRSEEQEAYAKGGQQRRVSGGCRPTFA